MIVISAAEVGIKEFISKMVPQAEWLTMHAPTPPLVAILEEYIPTLGIKNRLSPTKPLFSEKMIKTLRKGVLLRNQLVHSRGEINSDTLHEILTAVRDLLYLLDFFGGHAWATDNILYSTIEQLKDVKEASDNAR